MSSSPGAASIIAAAALSILSCRSAGVPEPVHPKAEAQKEVCIHSLPLAKARKTMAASLENECRRYCTYMSGGSREISPGIDAETRKVFSAVDLLLKALNYGSRAKGKALFCDYTPEKVNPEDSTATVLFRIGVENRVGGVYTIKRRVAFSFRYVPKEGASATGVNIIRLIPAWGAHPDYQFGIVSEERVGGVSRAPKRKQKSAPEGKKQGPSGHDSQNGLQKPPKKLLCRNPSPRRMPAKQLRRCARR